MRWRTLSVVLLILIVLIAGSPGLVRSSLMREGDGLENTVGLENLNSKANPFDPPRLDTVESLPLIPYTDSQHLDTTEDFYTFNFSAEKGDKIHLRVTSTRRPQLQVLLIPRDELTDDHIDRSFENITEKISEASNSATRDFRAHVTIPGDGDYSLVVRSPSRDQIVSRPTRAEMIVGRGLFSSIVVRVGGYIDLFFISSFFVIVSGAVFYLYKRRKKKRKRTSSLEEESEEWKEEHTEKSEESTDPRSEAQVSKDEVKNTPEDTEYLRYED